MSQSRGYPDRLLGREQETIGRGLDLGDAAERVLDLVVRVVVPAGHHIWAFVGPRAGAHLWARAEIDEAPSPVIGRYGRCGHINGRRRRDGHGRQL